MGKYLKVSPFVAEQLGLTDIRRKTADGNYILWQQDIAAIEGETLEEKCQYIGGVIIERKQGKTELKGTDEPIPLMEGTEDELPLNLPDTPEDIQEENNETLSESEIDKPVDSAQKETNNKRRKQR